MTAPDLCPLCGADLTGEPIPEEYRENHGMGTHYTRQAILYDPAFGYRYRCPDCNGTWPVEGQQK